MCSACEAAGSVNEQEVEWSERDGSPQQADGLIIEMMGNVKALAKHQSATAITISQRSRPRRHTYVCQLCQTSAETQALIHSESENSSEKQRNTVSMQKDLDTYTCVNIIR